MVKATFRLVLLLSAFSFLNANLSRSEAKNRPSPDHHISISVDDKSEANTVIFFAEADRTLESTIDFNCSDLHNLMPNHALPYQFLLNQVGKPVEFLRLRQAVTHNPWSYGDWEFHSKIGSPSQLKTIDYPYALPYPSREHYVVIQSFYGKYSHYDGSGSEYAVDFDMPEGSTVCAARGGTVIAFRDDSNVGGASEKFKSSDNYVVIKHDDGTYGSYAHFQHQGVLVKLGQQLNDGDKIGLSGATGWADKPHLHFAVYRVKDGEHSQTIPFHLKIGKVLIRRPIEGLLY